MEAAAELFVDRGYAGTTIDAVAERAGVSRRTVFQSVGSKVELLRTAWDWAVVATTSRSRSRPAGDRSDARGTRPHDVDRALGRPGAACRLADGPLAQVLARAVDVDPEAEALQARIDVERRTGASMSWWSRRDRWLRSDVSEKEGADMAWVLMNPFSTRRPRGPRPERRAGADLAGATDRGLLLAAPA